MTKTPPRTAEETVEETTDGTVDERAETTAGARSGGGVLSVVSTPIGNLGDLSARVLSTLRVADAICCEDTRHTGLLLQRSGIEPRRLISLHAHNEASRIEEVMAMLEGGAAVALVSDAGTPLISDPGERLVAAAIDRHLTVTAVPGPSAVLGALVLSGMTLERFAFEGFLPRRGKGREERLSAIAAAGCPSVCYEAPTRVKETVADLCSACGASRRVLVARELTKLHEELFWGTLAEASGYLEARTPRGEYVLVIGPADTAPVAPDEVAGALGRLIGAGLSRRDAVTAVEALYGVPHTLAYQSAIAITPPA